MMKCAHGLASGISWMAKIIGTSNIQYPFVFIDTPLRTSNALETRSLRNSWPNLNIVRLRLGSHGIRVLR
jgi:hypothetical protein